jgi:nucleoid-associated protein YgaU
MYEEAKVLLLDPTDCQIRLGLVAIKTEEWAIAQSHLAGVRGEQAAYLRGFAYAKQGNLQQAHREWQPLTQTTVEYQRNALKSLAQRQRLLTNSVNSPNPVAIKGDHTAPSPIVQETVNRQQPTQYAVKPGDNLTGITEQFCGKGKSWQIMVKANPQLNTRPDLINVGEALKLPNCEG